MPTLVRGLDYYSRTTWEFVGPMENENAVLSGGGRYDYLVEEIGGPPTPGVGFGAGIERLLIAMEEGGIATSSRDRRRLRGGRARRAARARPPLLEELRGRDIAADTDYAGRSLKGQLTQAGRSGAHTTVILRAGDALVRRAGAQDEPVTHADLLGKLSRYERSGAPTCAASPARSSSASG